MFAYWFLFAVFAIGAVLFRSPVLASGDPGTLDPKSRNIPFLFAAAAIPLLLIGFRYEVGADWNAYTEIYEQIGYAKFWVALWMQEPGYSALNWFASEMGLEIWAVNLVCGLIFIAGLIRFAKCQPNPWLAFVVAVPYLVIGVAMGYTRQSVAMGCVMFGLAAISRGSFRQFVFWVLVGATFHRTAVVLLPIVGMTYTRDRLQTILLAAIAAIAGYFTLVSSAIEQYSRGYVEQVYESQGAGVRLAMNIVPAVIFLAFSNRFNVVNPEKAIWRTFAILALVSGGVYFWITSTVVVDRLALYIIPLQIFVISRLPHVFGYRGAHSPAIVLLVIAYSATIQFVWLNYANHSQYWLPYQFYPLLNPALGAP